MKKVIVYLFAIIGIISLISKIIGFYRNDRIANKYWENCEKVEIGMTLEEARKIIGDYKFHYWLQDEKSGEIVIFKNENGIPIYSLVYPMIYGGDEDMEIIFDPRTLLVTEKSCGGI